MLSKGVTVFLFLFYFSCWRYTQALAVLGFITSLALLSVLLLCMIASRSFTHTFCIL